MNAAALRGRRFLDALTTHPVTVLAVIRLGALPVFLAGEQLVRHPVERSAGFAWVLALATLYALIALPISFAPERRIPSWLFAVLDFGFIWALVYTSGGPFSELRQAFLLLPISAALLLRPQLTAAASIAAILGYVSLTLLYPGGPDERPDAVGLEVTHVLFLGWMGGAATLLSRLLARRAEQIESLAISRGRLVAQALNAEDRTRRQLAEALHDEAIQNLLAARQELGAVAAGNGDLDLVQLGLDRTVSQLREAVFDLHPYLLEHGGLAAALQAVVNQQGRRASFRGEVAVAGDATGIEDQLLFSLARELIVNAAKHAQARHVRVSVAREGGRLVLEVADDGRGMDPERVRDAPITGHIGLASCAERVEALGGRFALSGRPGEGTVVRAEIPLVDRAPGSSLPAGRSRAARRRRAAVRRAGSPAA